VSGTEVTLGGTVPSRQQRRRAEICAERVSGVSHVQNNMRVKEEDGGRFRTAGDT
jgi:osmotically-inducible protein OsmY